MFCGKEIPDQAVFCPSCGARQPEPEKQEEPVDEIQDETDEDNIALSLLSKANFTSRNNNDKPPTLLYENKKPEKKAVKIESDGKPVPKKTEPETGREEEQIEKNNFDSSTSKIPTRITQKTEDIPSVEVSAEYEDYDEGYDAEDAEIMAKMMSMVQEGASNNAPSILDDITEEIREQHISDNYNDIVGSTENHAVTDSNDSKKEDNSNTKSASEQKEDIQKTKEHPLGTTASKENKKPAYRKRNLSEEDESEKDESGKENSRPLINTNSTISAGNGNDGLTADEIADIEKYKKYKESTEGKADKEERASRNPGEGRTIKGEGRKKGGRAKEIRRNIDKEIAERDIRDIQHEEAKDDSDKDYDGYYENVKPIDFDKMHDNTAVIKTSITGIAIVALVCIVFYFIITFFLQ